MTLLALLFACAPEPSAPPLAPLEAVRSPGDALSFAVRRAGHSEANACDAVSKAFELAPGWTGEPLPLGLARPDPTAPVEPDWRELALAAGPGPAANALITVGGVRVGLGAGCADVERLSRWMIRAPTLRDAPACMAPALRAQAATTLGVVLDQPCLCALPDEDALPRLVAGAKNSGLDPAVVARVEGWTGQPSWVACPQPAPPAPAPH